MTKNLDLTMGRLLDITKTFVKNAKRYCGPDAPYYEPPDGQGHIWAELCSTVEHAEDTIEDIRLEIEGGEELQRAVMRQMTEEE